MKDVAFIGSTLSLLSFTFSQQKRAVLKNGSQMHQLMYKIMYKIMYKKKYRKFKMSVRPTSRDAYNEEA